MGGKETVTIKEPEFQSVLLLGLRVSCVVEVCGASPAGGYWARILPQASEIAFRSFCASAFRSRVFELGEDSCSMGLRSGEYFGRNTRRAPTSRIALRTAFPLVGAEIVEDHDVACLQRRHEELFDIGVEAARR